MVRGLPDAPRSPMVDAPPEAALLVLTPADPGAAPHREAVVEALRAVGLIGAPVATDRGQHYLTGDRFFQLVTFLGCSPHLQLTPPDDPVPPPAGSFCTVAVGRPLPAPRLRHGRLTTAPRCPECGSPLVHWQAAAGGAAVTCPGCARQTSLADLNWRRNAGIGRLFVDLWAVYPREAVPAPELLETLERATGEPWRHFYLLAEQ